MRSFNFAVKLSAAMLLAAGTISCGSFNSENSQGPVLVKKPSVTFPEKKPLSLNPAPEALKEIPFKEINPEPQPNDMEKKLGFIIFNRPITETVYPQSKPLPYERISSLSTFATPGEFEPLALSIYPLKTLNNMSVTASELKSGKNTIPSSDIDVRLLTCRNILYPHYKSKDTYRRMPELLEKVTVNSMPEKESRTYWLKVKVPDNAAPGLYKGSVIISCDDMDQALSVPLYLRVLPFKLLKDPEKHYTAYNYDLHREVNDRTNTLRPLAKEKGAEWIYNAARNEYKSMVEYGFDTFPTLYLSYDSKKKDFYIINGERAIKEILAAGMKGPVPMVGGIGGLYYEFTKKSLGPHCSVPVAPPEEFYRAITERIMAFEKIRVEKGWPEFIYVPLDEVSDSSKEFGSGVYKAFKDAGVRTYATKDPKAADAAVYAPYVDFWCGQPFSAPYEEVMASKKHGYWCYPNHNSYEIKVPVVMCRGGRMTYGCGLWRSGYSLLIPWIWRSGRTDYLADGSAGGARFDDNGNVIPAVYWECFREGIDDLKYIYTLETAIVQRENSKDAECLKLVKEGKELLQTLWNSIKVQPKYLAANVWNPEEFTAWRWQIALMTEKLLKYPASNNKQSPSVIVDTKKQVVSETPESIMKKQRASGNLELMDLGDEEFASWKSVSSEGKIQVTEKFKHTGNKSLLFDVTVDHKTDGGGENGKYPVGWPRILMSFPANGIDLTKYDYIALWVMVDSERDEVADDFSPFYISIISAKRRGLYGKDIINEVEQRVWTPVILPIKEMISSPEDEEFWRCVTGIQFGISESKYKDGTKIRFYLDNISLIKFKHPVISSIDMPSALLLPVKEQPLNCAIMGASNASDKYILEAAISDAKGKVVSRSESKNISGNTFMLLDTSKLSQGDYKVRMTIKDASGKIYSSSEKNIKALNGPLVETSGSF